MRRLKSFLAVVVALVMLAGLAYLADAALRAEVENRIETGAADQVPELGGTPVQARVGGRFVIPQLIAGRLDDVRITAEEVTVDDVTITDVVVTATGVPARGGGTIGHVDATGSVPSATITSALEQRVDLPDGVTIETRDGEVVVVGSVLTLPVEIAVELVAQPRSIDLELTAFRLGDAEVDPSALPVNLLEQLGAGSIDLDELPEGLELTDVTSTDDGVDLVLAGDDLQL